MLLPAREDPLDALDLLAGEDVGVAAHELRRDRVSDGPEVVVLALLAEARVEDDLEEHVPELLLDLLPVALVERLQELERLLEEEGAERALVLRPVPRAAPLAAEPVHDGEDLGEALEAWILGLCHRNLAHGESAKRTRAAGSKRAEWSSSALRSVRLAT